MADTTTTAPVATEQNTATEAPALTPEQIEAARRAKISTVKSTLRDGLKHYLSNEATVKKVQETLARGFNEGGCDRVRVLSSQMRRAFDRMMQAVEDVSKVDDNSIHTVLNTENNRGEITGTESYNRDQVLSIMLNTSQHSRKFAAKALGLK